MHVKSLSIILGTYDSTRSLLDALTVLQACPNVECLDLRGFSPDALWEQTRLDNLHAFLISPSVFPRRLSITTNPFPEDQVTFSHPIFRNVTHLNLVWTQGYRKPEDEVGFNTLGGLENLTHLSISVTFGIGPGFSGWVSKIVSQAPKSLRILIIWIFGTWHFHDGYPSFNELRTICEGGVDSRVVTGYIGSTQVGTYTFSRTWGDVLRDCAGIPEGKDFWTLAEEMRDERRRLTSLQVRS